MEFGVSYGIAEALLVGLFEVPEPKWPAFRARLRLFKRLGFPAGINTGKGKHARYGARELTSLAVAIELLKVTQTSEQAVDLVRSHEETVRRAIREAAQVGLTNEPVYLVLSPGEPWSSDAAAWGSIMLKSAAEFRKSKATCLVAIDVSALAAALIRHLFLLLEGAEVAFQRDLDAWIRLPGDGEHVD